MLWLNMRRSPGLVSSTLGRDVAGIDSEPAVSQMALKGIGERLADAVAARNDAQGAGVLGGRVEVEGHLDAEDGPGAVAVGVPPGIAHVEVAVAAGVVEVLAAYGGRDVVYSRVVEERAQVLAPIGEWEDRGPGCAVVLSTVVPAAVVSPDRLELLDDPVDAVSEKPGEGQEPERPELLHLVVGQRFLGLHGSLLDGLFGIISRRAEARQWTRASLWLSLGIPLILAFSRQGRRDMALYQGMISLETNLCMLRHRVTPSR